MGRFENEQKYLYNEMEKRALSAFTISPKMECDGAKLTAFFCYSSAFYWNLNDDEILFYACKQMEEHKVFFLKQINVWPSLRLWDMYADICRNESPWEKSDYSERGDFLN